MTISGNAVIDLGKLRATIAEVLELDPDEITEDARFVDDLGVDSLTTMEMQIALEEEYGIKLTDDEVLSSVSLRAVHALLSNKTAG
jgi:acyl carrier protein